VLSNSSSASLLPTSAKRRLNQKGMENPRVKL
jgi:hypothetical protein